MSLDSFSKQPYEVFSISASFVSNLGDSETIEIGSSAVTAVDKVGNDATDDVIVSGTKAVTDGVMRVQITAGTVALSPYKITFRSVTNATPANKYELDVTMKVKEL